MSDAAAELTPEHRIWRLVIISIATFLVVVFLGMTTCTMHSNTYDDARARADAEKIRAQKELAQIENTTKAKQIEAKAKQIEAIERLIAKGINPVAARCAVEGWKGDSNGQICERVSSKGKLQ